MMRCAICGCSKLDAQGVGCARCGGSPAVPWEQVHVDAETKAKLLAHVDELKAFGITIEQAQLVQKDAGTTLSAIGLVLTVVESIHPGTLRSIVLYLRDLAIPEEQILRLRLDEPENISKILSEPPKKEKRKSSAPKRATKRSKKR
jgi:hypothetical protein